MNEDFVDIDLVKVWIASIISTSLNFVTVNAALTTVVLVGTAVYTWRKALKRREKKHRERRESWPRNDDGSI